MAIDDHVVILASHALAEARLNKDKQDKLEFYAQFAIPPEAIEDLKQVAQDAIPGQNLTAYKVSGNINERLDKPLPGIPNDWFVFRAATAFTPECYDEAAQLITDPAKIRAKFFAGARVRMSIKAWTWVKGTTHGISFNLYGVMAAPGKSVRLPLGNGKTGAAFSKHAVEALPTLPTGSDSATVEPIAQSGQTVTPPSVAGSFFQQPAAQAGNPFQQPAQAGNPFTQ